MAETDSASAAPEAMPEAADASSEPISSSLASVIRDGAEDDRAKSPAPLKAAADGRLVADGPAGGWRGRVLAVVSASKSAAMWRTCLASVLSAVRLHGSALVGGCEAAMSLKSVLTREATLQYGGGGG